MGEKKVSVSKNRRCKRASVADLFHKQCKVVTFSSKMEIKNKKRDEASAELCAARAPSSSLCQLIKNAKGNGWMRKDKSIHLNKKLNAIFGCGNATMCQGN